MMFPAGVSLLTLEHTVIQNEDILFKLFYNTYIWRVKSEAVKNFVSMGKNLF